MQEIKAHPLLPEAGLGPVVEDPGGGPACPARGLRPAPEDVGVYPNATDRLAAEQALRVHRQRSFADRAVGFRLSTLSKDSTTLEGGNRESRVLRIHIDGIGQAKLKRPRDQENSQGWASLWRLILHCVGAMVDGSLRALLPD